MENRPCPNVLRGCRQPKPFADNHHLYWPKSEYNTPLERKFRESSFNIVRGICRCMHDLEHLKRPPRKPTPDEMKRAL